MHCPKCGVEIPDDSKFCSECGAQLGDSASSAAERIRDAAKDTSSDKEEDLWEGTYSGKAMVGHAALAAVCSTVLLVVGIATAGWLLPIAIGAIVLIWLHFGLSLLLRKMNYKYELTTQRFIHKSGILTRVTDRIEVIDIDDVTFEQGIVERFVGVGTIRVQSSDRTHPELVLKGIDDVQRIADTIDDCRRKERRRRGLHIEAI